MTPIPRGRVSFLAATVATGVTLLISVAGDVSGYDFEICNNGRVCDMAGPGEQVSSCFRLVNQDGIPCSYCCAEATSKHAWTPSDGCSEALGACSGFHTHGYGTAPLPSSVQGACADASGYVCVSYTAPQQAGMTWIRWHYTDPSGEIGLDTEEDVILWTKLGAPDTGPPLSSLGYLAGYYDLVGGESTHNPGGDAQSGNHWGTDQTLWSLATTAMTWQEGPQPGGVTTCPPRQKLQINDISLGYGGVFDYTENWSSPHSEHRSGRNVDVASARNNANGVPINMEHDFCLIARAKGFAAACLHGGGAPSPCVNNCGGGVPHFHLTR